MDKKDLKIKKIPDKPGVYIFQNGRGTPLYIGRAKSLKSRVSSYFNENIGRVRSPLIGQMIQKTKRIKTIPTDNHLDAFILEAYLIKQNKPTYNSREKDNKSFNFVVITKEPFPRVLIVRGREIDLKYSKDNTLYIFGPFPKGDIFKNAMRIIRKIFPYRDRCIPATENKKGKLCFQAQIALCSGVCGGLIGEREYQKNIKDLAMFFSGDKVKLIKKFEKEMQKCAKAEEFEKAQKLKKTILSLKHIQDVSLIRGEYLEGSIQDFRIEGYDVSHTHGSQTVGVMTVVSNGEPATSEYRKFHIRQSKAMDDLGALEEILMRRFKHTEWKMPNLVVVDGGKTHLEIAKKVLTRYNLSIPIVAVTKDKHHKPRILQGDQISANIYKKAILLVNSEAHRFAISWHRRLRDKI